VLNKYLAKIEEWLLKKEEEMAKNCQISVDDVDREIGKLLLKIKELKEQCNEQKAEFEYLLDKLHWIKAEAIKCQEELDKEIKK